MTPCSRWHLAHDMHIANRATERWQHVDTDNSQLRVSDFLHAHGHPSCLYLHLKAQRGPLACPRSHSSYAAELPTTRTHLCPQDTRACSWEAPGHSREDASGGQSPRQNPPPWPAGQRARAGDHVLATQTHVQVLVQQEHLRAWAQRVSSRPETRGHSCTDSPGDRF